MFSLLCLAALWVYSRISSKSMAQSSPTLYSRQVDFPIFPNLILCTMPLFQPFTLPRLEVGSSYLTHQNITLYKALSNSTSFRKYRHSLLSLVFVFFNCLKLLSSNLFFPVTLITNSKTKPGHTFNNLLGNL